MSALRDLRNRVVLREDFCCLRCGQWAEGGSLHHRKLRSQAGQDSIENLILACGSGSTGCHSWFHESRTAAAALGFIVPSWEDPATVPVVVYGRGRVYLTADGTYAPGDTDMTGYQPAGEGAA